MIEENTRYPKIYNPFKRSPDGKKVLPGEFALPEFEDLFDGVLWTASEKLDGTNLRVTWQPRTADGARDVITINGRKGNSQLHGDLVESLKQTFHEKGRWHAAFKGLDDTNHVVTLYGEGVGPGIQKGGGRYGDRKHFVLFDVRIGALWLTQADVTDIAQKMAISRAPVFKMRNTLREWCRLASYGVESPYAIAAGRGEVRAEGFMCRPVGNYLSRLGSRIICKVKTRELEHAEVKRWLAVG